MSHPPTNPPDADSAKAAKPASADDTGARCIADLNRIAEEYKATTAEVAKSARAYKAKISGQMTAVKPPAKEPA